MATYPINDENPPTGAGYRPGDIVVCPQGSVVPRWKYVGDEQWVPANVVEFVENEVTGGIGIIGPDGMQVAGNAAPYSFTSRQLADTDNGMNLVCATAQTATVNADLPVGFGCSFEGAISFTAGDGVTIADLRTTGATDIFCGLMQTGANAYKVRGGKA